MSPEEKEYSRSVFWKELKNKGSLQAQKVSLEGLSFLFEGNRVVAEKVTNSCNNCNK